MGGIVEGFEEKGSSNGLYTNNIGCKARARVKSVSRGTNYLLRRKYEVVGFTRGRCTWEAVMRERFKTQKKGVSIEFAFVFANNR